MHLAALLLVTPLALYWLTLPVPAETWDHFSMDSCVVGVSWLLSALTLNAYLPVSSMMDMWNPPSWSICDEMFFYVSFPLILVLGKRWFRPSLHGAAAIVVLLSVLSLASNAFMVGLLQNVVPVQAAQTDLMFVGRFPILRLPEFVAGCLTCLLFQGMKQQGLYAWLGNRRVRDVCVGLSVVLLLGVAAAHAIRLPLLLKWRVLTFMSTPSGLFHSLSSSWLLPPDQRFYHHFSGRDGLSC